MIAIAIITESRLGPSIAAMAIAISKPGIESMMSTIRMMIVSTLPGKAPASHTESQPADHAKRRRHHTDQQRLPSAIDNPAELVAAQLVEPEPVLGRRTRNGGGRDHAGTRVFARAVGGDQRREDRDQDEERDQPEPDQGDRVAAQPAPGVSTEAAALVADLGGLGRSFDFGKAHRALAPPPPVTGPESWGRSGRTTRRR